MSLIDQESEASDLRNTLKRRQSIRSRKSGVGLLDSETDSNKIKKLRQPYKKTTFLKKGSSFHFFEDSKDILKKLGERSREQVASIMPIPQLPSNGMISKSRSQKNIKTKPDFNELAKKRRSANILQLSGSAKSLDFRSSKKSIDLDALTGTKKRESKFALTNRSRVSQLQFMNISQNNEASSSFNSNIV